MVGSGSGRSWDRDGLARALLEPVELPRMVAVRQRFPGAVRIDVAAAVRAELARPEIAATIRPGMTVAVPVSSRGIANQAAIVRELVAGLRARGARPFLFPAMGSHGGATAAGQRELIEGYGVTEEAVGGPIVSRMETRVIGRVAGLGVHLDQAAAEADGIVVLGRVKPHTAFRGRYESGLMKMMAIGMGKQKGAEACHAAGFGRFHEIVPAFGREVLARAPILFGLAILENALDDTARIEAVPRAAIEQREPELLEEARRNMPGIPFAELDVLVVDEIGKNFSGDGADPNVTGVYCTPYASGGPKVGRYVVLDLSEETHGNAVGLGMADITTARVFAKVDLDAMYVNALTNRVLNIVRMPMVMADDRQALKAAVWCCLGVEPAAARVVRIVNTSHLSELWISEALLPAARALPTLEILGDPAPPAFDAAGNLRREVRP
jgi:hypothetical protein